MTLREYMIDYRNRHGLSQRQLATQCGVTNGYISMIEADKNPHTNKPIAPSLANLKKLASGMGISLQDLLDIVDDHPVSMIEELTEKEKTLLRLYRRMTDAERDLLLRTAEAFSK